MADNIAQLPTDVIEPTPQEVQILNTLFGETKKNKNFNLELKNLIILFILFIILSTPQVNQLLEKFISISLKSIYINILIKAIIFIIIYWLIVNFSLSKQT
jgi:hypothetical protein